MSLKQDQVLIIDPATELSFTGPFTSAVSSLITLTNPTDRKVCFKIKTTAPKRYCVKPNSGIVEPKQKVLITVTLQPFEFDPNEKNRHKFMVQSTYAPEGEFNQETMWKEIDGKGLMDSKLKCVFILPDDATVVNGSAYTTAKNEESAVKTSIQASPKFGDADSARTKRTAEEIAELSAELSALRKINLELREEILRQQRQAVSPNTPKGGSDSRTDPILVKAGSPNETSLTTGKLYIALAIFILGIIIGKVVF